MTFWDWIATNMHTEWMDNSFCRKSFLDSHTVCERVANTNLPFEIFRTQDTTPKLCKFVCVILWFGRNMAGASARACDCRLHHVCMRAIVCFVGGSFCNMIADGSYRCSAAASANIIVPMAIWDRFRLCRCLAINVLSKCRYVILHWCLWAYMNDYSRSDLVVPIDLCIPCDAK